MDVSPVFPNDENELPTYSWNIIQDINSIFLYFKDLVLKFRLILIVNHLYFHLNFAH